MTQACYDSHHKEKVVSEHIYFSGFGEKKEETQ